MKALFQVELVWNSEFHFVAHGPPYGRIGDAIAFAEKTQNAGDGARVKKTRVVDDSGEVVWADGRLVKPADTKTQHIHE